MYDARGESHLRPKDIVLANIDGADVNPGPHSSSLKFRMPGVEVQCMGIVERSSDVAEHRHNAIADRLYFAPGVFGYESPTANEVRRSHLVHPLVPKLHAQCRGANYVGEHDRQRGSLTTGPIDQTRTYGVGSLGHVLASCLRYISVLAPVRSGI